MAVSFRECMRSPKYGVCLKLLATQLSLVSILFGDSLIFYMVLAQTKSFRLTENTLILPITSTNISCLIQIYIYIPSKILVR